ncbi:beta family protein [Achromobacter xylosoxidans]|uniref:beta family protein n=1 Tax=Alcaligenes xylosoxydans xylosoxydans TaxID=85698 RepID=UPI001F13E4E5|nr:beta family protein [Achromobacter xylosoxidans]
MMSVNFEDYLYYPALRTRGAELRGLAMLDEARKAQIIPLITLGKWPKSDDFARSLGKAQEAMSNNAFFLDLPDDPRHHSATSLSLADPSSNFAAWREFTGPHENIIPVVQTSQGNRRQIVQQAMALEQAHGSLGFRIRDFQRDTPLVIAALSALDNVHNALVFVDAQYIRSAVPAYIAAVTAAINAVRTEVPETLISVLSTSFPSARTQFFDPSRERGTIPILDRELHESVGGNNVAIYGDYGSIHAVIYDDQPIMKWSPTIDYALEYDWVFERRPGVQNNSLGYQHAAQALLDRFPHIENSEVWGDEKIREAAQGNPHGSAPQSWISVRVNLHLAKQIDFSYQSAEEEDDFDL